MKSRLAVKMLGASVTSVSANGSTARFAPVAAAAPASAPAAASAVSACATPPNWVTAMAAPAVTAPDVFRKDRRSSSSIDTLDLLVVEACARAAGHTAAEWEL